MVPQNRRPNKPITQELADTLAPRIVKSVVRVRRGRWVCWESTSNINPKTGYANIGITRGGKTRYYFRHRVMYVHYFGPFPAELTIDHLCENRACCNPRHLRPATHAENTLRSSLNPSAVNARRTHCANGHLLPERTLTVATKRRCSVCYSEKWRRQRESRYARGLEVGDPRHGTRTGYGNWGCRCDACKAWASADYRASRGAA